MSGRVAEILPPWNHLEHWLDFRTYQEFSTHPRLTWQVPVQAYPLRHFVVVKAWGLERDNNQFCRDTKMAFKVTDSKRLGLRKNRAPQAVPGYLHFISPSWPARTFALPSRHELVRPRLPHATALREQQPGHHQVSSRALGFGPAIKASFLSAHFLQGHSTLEFIKSPLCFT